MTRVLVLGYRKGLARALHRRGIPYALWNEKPASPLHKPVALWIGRYPMGEDDLAPALERSGLAAAGPFTHVIAGTEAAVIPCSLLRRTLGARPTADETILRCRDKLLMKQWLEPLGIPMTEYLPGDGAGATPRGIAMKWGWPVVVKARLLSGSRELVFARNDAELARSMGEGRILERFVNAPECSVESFIRDGRVLFTNITEYTEKTIVNLMPAGVDHHTHAALLDLNERVIASLGIGWGITHLETYLTASGPLFGEIAIRPPGGYLMELIKEAYGFDPWDALIAMELGEGFAFPPSHRRFAASWVLHPGKGRVAAIRGEKALRSRPAVRKIRLKAAPGDEVGTRMGTGEDVGHVILSAPTRDELIGEIEHAKRTLKVELV